MSYYVTNENSVLNINNAHLKVSGNVMTDVMKLGAIEFAPPASNVGGTVNFTNVTTGVTTSSNLSVGGTLSLGTVEVVATTHTLANTTANGNVTPHTVQFSNATTGIVTTANVEVGGELAVTGNVSDLNVVSNVNLLHTSNTAALKLNSNVVTEFHRSKKLIKYPRVLLTSAALNSAYENGYRVTFSNENTLYRAYHPFSLDENSAVGWHSQSAGESSREYNGTGGLYSGTTRLATETVLGEWLGLELPDAIKLQSIRMVSQSYSPAVNTIDDFVIYAKKQSGDTWTSLGTFTGMAGSQNSVAGVTVNVDAMDYYKFFALVATKRDSPGTTTGVSIRVLEYFGVPETDPEADGVDVTVKSVPNVPNTDFLEVYYDAKNYTSGVVQDLSTNSFDGTLTNGASFNNSDGIGKFVFDGSNDYISGSIPSTFTGNQTYTFSIWVKPDSHPSSGFVGVFEVGTRSPDDAMGLYFDTGKIIHLAYADNLATTTVATIGQWVHITGTYTSGDRRVYANGNLLKQDDYSGLTLAGTTFTLGSNRAGGQNFNGSIANFRLFNRALTTDEIYQLYAYQKEYFGHGDLSMTLKAGRLGIGTSEPSALLDVGGEPFGPGSRPIFRALSDSSSTLSYDATEGNKIFTNEFNSAHINVTNSYSTSTGRFTAPISGYYYFEFQILVAVPNAHYGTTNLTFYKNGTNVNRATSSRGLGYTWINNDTGAQGNYGTLDTPTIHAILYLTRGEYVQGGYVSVGSSSGSTSYEYSKNYGFFQGYLLST